MQVRAVVQPRELVVVVLHRLQPQALALWVEQRQQ
jgi:hypothetical protein